MFKPFREVLIVDSISYIKALDHVLSIIFNEGWKFISSPTVFLTLVISFFLWTFRNSILSMFPAIKEIKAGPFSASLSYIVQNSSSENSNKENQDISDQIDRPKEDTVNQNEEIVDYIVSRLGIKSCQLFLDADKSLLTVNDWIRKMSELGIYEPYIKTDDEKLRYQFYYGLFRGTEKYALGKLFSKKISGPETKAIYFELLPKIREKIESRYGELETVVRKDDEKERETDNL